MARNPRTKLAAIAFAAIASLGMIAASPATASHAGRVHHMHFSRDTGGWCC